VNALAAFQQRIGYAFRDDGLLRLALTHPSLAHDQTDPVSHNQRLEFLGDAVLQLVLTRELYDRFPEVDEGPLTQARAQMVNRRTLASQGRRLALGEHLRLSRGEAATGGREKASVLADAFEALVGAIYLDGGLEAASDFLGRQFREAFGELEVIPSLDNPKGELQEWLQAASPGAPQYRVESASGPDHERVFECAVYHGGRELGRGQGRSKKEAESRAASVALENLRAGTTVKPAQDGSPGPA
jgi:ribonuclease-3